MDDEPFFRKELINKKLDLSKVDIHKQHAFSVVTYNILAQVYTKQENFPYCKHSFLRQKYRRDHLLHELKLLDADVYCFQELDDHKELGPKLFALGYESIFKRRTGKKRDGCAIFWRDSKLILEKQKSVELNDFCQNIPSDWNYMRDNVGIMAIFRFVDSDDAICVATTHLYWDPEQAEVKFAQMKAFLTEVEEFNVDKHPTIICGDLNSLPESAVYQFIVHGTVDYTHPELSHIVKTRTSIDRIVCTPLPNNNNSVNDSDINNNNESSKDSTKEGKQEIDLHSIKAELEAIYNADKRWHNIPLVSAYTNYNDTGKEPPFTNYQAKFNGTIDYIFYDNNRIKLQSILELPAEEKVKKSTALPNGVFTSDHLSLKANFMMEKSK